jgi:hypothetical protein
MPCVIIDNPLKLYIHIYIHTYSCMQLLVVFNLFFATMGSNDYICCMQLKISCIKQLQNDKFLVM